MKKAFTIFLLLAICFSLTSCGKSSDSGSAESGYDTGYDDGYADGYAAALEAIDSGSAENTEDNEFADIGTIDHPAETGEAVNVTINSSHGNGTISLTLDEVVSGDKAMEMLAGESEYNVKPRDGKQYIMAKFTIEFTDDASGGQTPVTLDYSNFSYGTTQKVILDNNTSVVYNNICLNVSLTKGQSASGWIAFTADKDEESPYAVFGDNVWFRLTGK